MASLPGNALTTLVRSVPGPQRALMAGMTLLLVGGLLALGVWFSRPTYVPIFQGLELAEIGRVSDVLSQRGVRFRLSASGQDLEVPVGDVARARVMVAQDGLPADGRPGLELFDRPSWGMTDFTQRITYRRALEGELSRTIRMVRGVEGAQVHLALPESSPLRRLDHPVQAAVVLTLRPGATLAPETVRGISHILSNSVERLSPEHVAVMDDSGRLLSSPMDGDGSTATGMTTRQLEAQRAVEGHLRDKVAALLTAAVGAGAARVEVTAQLNFEQVDRTTESFDPEGQVLSSEQVSEGGGAPGSTQTVYNNTYQNTRRLEKIIGAVGSIQRMTVAVLLDERVIASLDADGGRRASLEVAIRNAIGFDAARGDQLSLLAMPFGIVPGFDSTLSLPPEAPEGTLWELVERLGQPVASLLAILVAFLLGWRALGPVRTPRSAPPGSAPPPLASEPEELAIPAPTPANMKLRAQLQQHSTTSPETAAKVIRAWLAEETA